jgi:hypothetical protein
MLDEYLREQRLEIAQRAGLIFPYWSGEPSVRVLDETTANVSRMFREVFAAAGITVNGDLKLIQFS